MSVPLMMQMLFGFQLTAARRRLPVTPPRQPYTARFNSQPPEGDYQDTLCRHPDFFRFNSQPLEGGCALLPNWSQVPSMFQLTAARRRLPNLGTICRRIAKFQLTAARRRLQQPHRRDWQRTSSFNSQPPEGGCASARHGCFSRYVSTHSRPKAAAPAGDQSIMPPEFQLTAARRRLPRHTYPSKQVVQVSTHSRPKAAAPAVLRWMTLRGSFNSQPPEGGCIGRFSGRSWVAPSFNSQPPEGGCLAKKLRQHLGGRFNSQPPEGGCQAQSLRVSSLMEFQLTAARRRLRHVWRYADACGQFQLTAARRRLPQLVEQCRIDGIVSTHSRSKAAANAAPC